MNKQIRRYARAFMRDLQAYNHQAETEKAMAVVERYFDTDIKTADDAYDVLVDNGVDPAIANGMAADMYPEVLSADDND